MPDFSGYTQLNTYKLQWIQHRLNELRIKLNHREMEYKSKLIELESQINQDFNEIYKELSTLREL